MVEVRSRLFSTLVSRQFLLIEILFQEHELNYPVTWDNCLTPKSTKRLHKESGKYTKLYYITEGSSSSYGYEIAAWATTPKQQQHVRCTVPVVQEVPSSNPVNRKENSPFQMAPFLKRESRNQEGHLLGLIGTFCAYLTHAPNYTVSSVLLRQVIFHGHILSWRPL